MNFAQVSVPVAAGVAGILCREAAVQEGLRFWLCFSTASASLIAAMVILSVITKKS